MSFPNYQLQKVLKSLKSLGCKDSALSKMGPTLRCAEDEEIGKRSCLISSNSI